MRLYRLTKKQLAVLIEIESYIAKHKYPPTVRELMATINLQSPSTMHGHLSRLKAHGLIGWEPKLPRTLHIIRHSPVEQGHPG